MTTLVLISVDTAESRSNGEPLLTQGLGLQSCEKLRPDLKPDAGLNHMPNALLFYWFQGYLSAANIYLLKEHMDYVDIGAVDAATITQIVAEFCKKIHRQSRSPHWTSSFVTRRRSRLSALMPLIRGSIEVTKL
jgi:hypothetical protein